MTDYDPNLPQEFAHMPKRHGLGAAMLAVALVVVFVLAGLFATLNRPAPMRGDRASTLAQPPSDPGIPSPEK
jgi:hypothetical protein